MGGAGSLQRLDSARTTPSLINVGRARESKRSLLEQPMCSAVVWPIVDHKSPGADAAPRPPDPTSARVAVPSIPLLPPPASTSRGATSESSYPLSAVSRKGASVAGGLSAKSRALEPDVIELDRQTLEKHASQLQIASQSQQSQQQQQQQQQQLQAQQQRMMMMRKESVVSVVSVSLSRQPSPDRPNSADILAPAPELRHGPVFPSACVHPIRTGSAPSSEEQQQSRGSLSGRRHNGGVGVKLAALSSSGDGGGGSGGGGTRQHELAAWALGKLRTRVRMTQVTKSYARFVPEQVIHDLGKQSIEELDVGDVALLPRCIMVCDIRRFTALSERMGAATTYRFLNGLYRRLLPCVHKNNGFVDKFMGDAIIAVFKKPGDAIAAARTILRTIVKYNRERAANGWEPINMGCGLHAGEIMLGTVGDPEHMTVTSIGRSIMVATYVEMMTKFYHCDIVATDVVVRDYVPPADVAVRRVDRVKIHSESAPMDVYQIVDAELLPQNLMTMYESAFAEWQAKRYMLASNLFTQCITQFPTDGPSAVLSERLWRVSRDDKLLQHYEPVFFFNGLNMKETETDLGAEIPHQFNLMRLAFSAVYHLQKRMLTDPPVTHKSLDWKRASQQQQGNTTQSGHNFSIDDLLAEDFTTGSAVAEAMLSPRQKAATKHRRFVSCVSDRAAESVSQPQAQPQQVVVAQAAMPGSDVKDDGTRPETPVPTVTVTIVDPDGVRGPAMPVPRVQPIVVPLAQQPSTGTPILSSRDVARTDVLDVLETASIFAPNSPGLTLPPSQAISLFPPVPKVEKLVGKDRDMAKWVISGMQTGPKDAAQELSRSYARFLPQQFLSHLGKGDIQEVDIGDNVLLQMTVMFIEIKAIGSEMMPADQEAGAAFKVLTATSKYIAPCVVQNDGYVDKFFSDMMLALFDSAGGAMEAGLQILEAVKEVNGRWAAKNRPYSLGVSIGVNTGPCILGTVGDTVRMEATVIGNTVNVASRLLGLTKAYGVRFVTSSNTGVSVPKLHPNYSLRELDLVKLAGTNDPVWVLEVVNTSCATSTLLNDFHVALSYYHNRDFAKALEMFTQCLLVQPLDIPSQVYAERCSVLLQKGVPEDWSNVFCMAYK